MIKINDFCIKKTTHRFPYLVFYNGCSVCRYRSLDKAIYEVILILNQSIW